MKLEEMALTEQYQRLPTFSIQEMVEKTADQREVIQHNLEATKPYYDWDETSVFHGNKPEHQVRVLKTLREMSLKDLVARSVDDLPWLRPKLKEFLAKSGTTGIAGAAYLIPDKIYQVMFDSAVQADICADISIAMVPADEIPGANLKVDIAKDGSYKPQKYSSGGSMPTETIETVQAEMSFINFGINFQITNDLIEDAQFDVVEMHLRNAGREMGEFASNLAVYELINTSDGDGTKNTGTTTTATTTSWTGDTTYDIEKMIDEVVQDGYVSDTILLSHHSMMHSVIRTLGSTSNQSEPWVNNVVSTGGWPTRMFDHNIVYSEVDSLTNDGTYDPMKCAVFAKEYALLTGRKRWLRIEKYSDPIRDLIGATITARQDSVTVYNDAAAVLTENT